MEYRRRRHWKEEKRGWIIRRRKKCKENGNGRNRRARQLSER